MKKCLTILLVLLFSGSGCGMCANQDQLQNITVPTLPVQENRTNFEPGVIIIKFKKDKANSPYLNELNQKYQLVQMNKLSNDARSIDDIKKKYPKRSRRIPKDAVVPNGLIYKMEFKDKNVDVQKIGEEYARDPNVEYAQPNYYVSTNTK